VIKLCSVVVIYIDTLQPVLMVLPPPIVLVPVLVPDVRLIGSDESECDNYSIQSDDSIFGAAHSTVRQRKNIFMAVLCFLWVVVILLLLGFIRYHGH
jgi:hypothetical protein